MRIWRDIGGQLAEAACSSFGMANDCAVAQRVWLSGWSWCNRISDEGNFINGRHQYSDSIALSIGSLRFYLTPAIVYKTHLVHPIQATINCDVLMAQNV